MAYQEIILICAIPAILMIAYQLARAKRRRERELEERIKTLEEKLEEKTGNQ